MAHELKELRKFGGVAFMVSGMLFLARHLLDLMAGPPPSSGAEIVAWVESGRLVLSLVSEVLFFAALSLVPAVIALYHSLASVERTRAALGCAIIAVVIPVLVLLVIVHGRLVYPVHGLRAITPTSAELVVALFYGGLHATGLLFGVATFVLSLAMKRVYGVPVAYLGFVTAACDVIGAYPYVIGPVLALLCEAFFAAWFVAVGLKLYRMS